MRRVALDHAGRDPDFALAAVRPNAGAVTRAAFKLVRPPARLALRGYYGVGADDVARAWERLDAAIERFKAELGPSGYLAGDGFSVADLTFAALVGSAAQPPGFPYPAQEPHRGVPQLRSLLAEKGVLEWVEDVYARHRGARLRP